MKKLIEVMGVVCIVALLTGNASGLDIQLSPRTLVLSSGGNQLTIHTDVPEAAVCEVALDIGGPVVDIATFADDCGNLVVRCSKGAVEEAVGDFPGRFTTIDVTLAIECLNGTQHRATETLRVRK